MTLYVTPYTMSDEERDALSDGYVYDPAIWTPEEIATDRACIQAAADMRRLDGLLDPRLDDVFARLSRKPTRQIGEGHNMNYSTGER